MSSDASALNNSNTIDPSIFWETSGVLSKATSEGALFSLYLAMHQHAIAEPLRIKNNESESSTNSLDAELLSLNHYPKASLEASNNDWDKMATLSKLMTSDLATARLYQVMNPQPLTQTNDASRLSDDVVNNCSLGAQKRISTSYSNEIEEDNTLMYDVLSASSSFDNQFAL
ncbi:VC2046/SO_2500 family protein [Alteromonas gracilis]|uniref:VC2046/SO_2500 family protein n=1 Tax=Alteromonas gracilis TaxID=1479524 RepID=UPI0030D43EC6